MIPSIHTSDSTAFLALHELAQQFDQQGYALKRFSHCGGVLIASRDGDVRHLDGIADAKRFLRDIEEVNNHG